MQSAQGMLAVINQQIEKTHLFNNIKLRRKKFRWHFTNKKRKQNRRAQTTDPKGTKNPLPLLLYVKTFWQIKKKDSCR